MDILEKYDLYDKIIECIDKSPNHRVTQDDLISKHCHSINSGNSVLERTRFNNEYRRALQSLVDEGLVIKGISNYNLSSKGEEKLVHKFKETHLNAQKLKQLTEESLIVNTKLAKAQIEDIRKTKIRSRIALCISIIALVSSIFTNFSSYMENRSNDKNHQNPSRKKIKTLKVNTPSKESINDTVK